ncbi:MULTISPECIES: PL29 family lyase N-terminal domain-containing protein [Bacteroides]|uniref:DUF4988 domain-containing protein n=1 Tax=Bacteroides ovatus TaxID=28116 RepID=A0A413EGS4_BACOV|nr:MULTISPECIES: PL29 family lyase N-terminal domain-containing protein [Bacteroides]RGE77602.1 hypothetical protein DWZ47_16770 [Bacteroides sp. AF32-8BH]RGX06107.1 hypothetical protein DWV35_23075 [Bacteroides ovatus]RGX17659.1 hypothetical protein DWV30_22870 [Bacteroides ovatus]
MRRNHFLCSMGKYVCFLAVCVVMLSSCYNDDDLKNSISGLEDRMDKLEASLQSVQTDLSTLKTLTDALSQNKSIASVLENEDGSYTIKFSDQTEVTIRNGENGEDAPQITVIKNEEDGIYYWGITGTDGKKTFLKDGEGNLMPVTAAAPKIRINTNTKEWEISTDGGKTWDPTGVYASGEGTGDASLFSEVSQDDDYAYFTLKDGTILKLLKSKELKCDILSGKQYFKNGEEKLISVEMSGISKYTVTKPDGWKASLSGKGLTITAPVTENQYAEMSGKVAIMAVASGGQSIISEIPVIIGDAPVVISTVGQTVSTTLTNGIEMYYLGVLEINEYSAETVAELVNGYTARMYMKTKALDKMPLAELIGKDPEAGMTYMVWAVPPSDTGEYLPDDVIATVIKIDPTVELKVSNITFEGATVSAIRKGCGIYYTGIADKANYSPEGVIDDLSFGGGNKQNSDYNGPLEGKVLDFLPRVIPGTTYVLWAIPYKEDKEYKTDELVTVEIPVPALTYDGTATINIGNIVTTVSSVSATITPGTDCYKFYYSYMKEQTLANYGTDKEVISYLIKNGDFSKEAENFERASLEPGTKGSFVAVALNDKGQLGSLVKVQADSKEISYNSSISVDVAIDAGTMSTTLTLTPTGNPVKFRYVHMKSSDFKNYPYWGDEETVKQALIMNSNVSEIVAAELKNHQLVIEDIAFNSEYVLFMIAVDAVGNPSSTMTKKVYTSAKPTFVRKDRDTDLWNTSVPEVTIDKIEKDKFYTVSYTVKPKSGCKVFYVFAGPADYLTGMYDEQIRYVMKNGVKQTTTYSGSIYGTLPANINVTWVDEEGRFYEVSKTVVDAPTQ